VVFGTPKSWEQRPKALPSVPAALAGPLNVGLSRLTGNSVSQFMTSPAFQQLWVRANTVAHRQLIALLN
jgi:hypothetical protein